MFKICARTVLELGSELISSDVIAFYELIKNTFDAGSPTGAELRFEVTLRRNDYLRFRRLATEGLVDIVRLKLDIKDALNPSASQSSLDRFRKAIDQAETPTDFVIALDQAYVSENRIIVSDEGHGMSHQDLINNYLVLGTPSRKHAIDAAIANRTASDGPPPFLGEKGIGRLSAMRLGDRLTVETAQKDDQQLNILKIDWSAFDDLTAMLDEIYVAPETGDEKPGRNWSGTRLIVESLAADWNFDRVKLMAEYEFARLTDPFSDAKRRPRIAIFWNGERVPVAHMDSHLLSHAHATVRGKYLCKKNRPNLVCTFEARDLGFEHPHEVETREFCLPDLEGSIRGTSGVVPLAAFGDLGPFEFEAYWFNRQRLGSIDSIGDRKVVRELQKRWSGILLYRDGFRVFPYGEDEDDWLALDRRALGSRRYLLNKAQFVGRVTISRLGNRQLIDQTNREGLRVCPEQQAFVDILQLAIQYELRDFLKDVESRHRDQPLDLDSRGTNITNLLTRANAAIRRIKRKTPVEAETVKELQLTFLDIKEFLEKAHRRIREVESESRQMIHMAGVGLLVEVVAHELARSTENALAALDALRDKDVPNLVGGLLENLRSEMRSVSKRLRILDPLSVSGRQRKEKFDLGCLIDDVLGGHEKQFARHHVHLKVTKPERPIRVHAVKGMLIQIIENLVSNSLYWLDLRRQHELDFKPCITISLRADPLTIFYEDNGRGIAKENREKVFRAFYSLKEKTKRRGLGLFIARDCAEYHGGTLTLDEIPDENTGRLHRFVLTFPQEVVLQ
ncbi:MAG: sensor histidine kinase [Gemmatimonadota bacterium]|nr:sensor histidine kinase [Gemmatimonadota bacterium]